jgi:hypothetical protein
MLAKVPKADQVSPCAGQPRLTLNRSFGGQRNREPAGSRTRIHGGGATKNGWHAKRLRPLHPCAFVTGPLSPQKRRPDRLTTWPSCIRSAAVIGSDFGQRTPRQRTGSARPGNMYESARRASVRGKGALKIPRPRTQDRWVQRRALRPRLAAFAIHFRTGEQAAVASLHLFARPSAQNSPRGLSRNVMHRRRWTCGRERTERGRR